MYSLCLKPLGRLFWEKLADRGSTMVDYYTLDDVVYTSLVLATVSIHLDFESQ